MEKINLLDVNKPEKLKDKVNELVDAANTKYEDLTTTKADLGLENVDNTSDADKPVSASQQKYIDDLDAQNVKLASQQTQTLSSDIEFNEGKKLLVRRGDNTTHNAVSLSNDTGSERLNVGSPELPIKFAHSTEDINGLQAPRNPEIDIKESDGTIRQEKIAFLSDVTQFDAMNGAETVNGVVTDVTGRGLSDALLDEMALIISVRSIITGDLIKTISYPIKLASTLSRGLMSKEQVDTLNTLTSRVAGLEGKQARYLYSASENPTKADIEDFVTEMGLSTYAGVTIVVEYNSHHWHYYENDEIGWRDDGVDTVAQATNDGVLGIVLGSEETGKVYVESDGTMSLVGFDEVKNKADAAVSSVSVAAGTQNGTIKLVVVQGGKTFAYDNIPVKGLGTMAYANASNYPTTTQMNSAISAALSSEISSVMEASY